MLLSSAGKKQAGEGKLPAARKTTGRRVDWTLALQAFLLVVLLLEGRYYSDWGIGGETLIYLASWQFTLVCAWCLWSWRFVGNALFSAYLLFFMAAALVNAGHCFLEPLQLNPLGVMNSRFPVHTTIETILFITLCLISMHLGALFKATRWDRTGKEQALSPQALAQESAAIRTVGYALLFISIVPLIVMLRAYMNAVMSEGYFALFDPSSSLVSPAVSILATVSMPGVFLLLADSRTRPLQLVVAVSVIAGTAGVLLFAGARIGAFTMIIPAVWLYDQAVRRLSRPLLLAGAAVLLILIPTIRSIRDVEGKYRASAASYLEAFESTENPFQEAFYEMGGTMQNVGYVMELVPSTREYDYGLSYAYAMSTILPNFGGGVHPAAQRSLSAWLIQTVDPRMAAQGGGLAFSYIAEAYLNFGWYGGPIFAGVLGFVLAGIFLSTERRPSLAMKAVAATFFAFLLIYSRSEASSLVRGALWYSLVPYAAVLVITKRSANKQHKGVYARGTPIPGAVPAAAGRPSPGRLIGPR